MSRKTKIPNMYDLAVIKMVKKSNTDRKKQGDESFCERINSSLPRNTVTIDTRGWTAEKLAYLLLFLEELDDRDAAQQ